MPRPPRAADATTRMPAAVFSPVAHRLAERQGPIYPLHVGDTWMEPFEGGRMEDLRVVEHPGMHRYAPTQGIPPLIDALVEKLRTHNQLPCERNSVLVTGGATAGLAGAVGMLADPGDEVLILAPFWPLIRGIVQAFRAVPVEVPFYDVVDTADEAVAAVRRWITPRTTALYVSTPSNPTGRVLSAEWLAALAELAREANLWLLSDEVYENTVYAGEHVSMGRYAPERTISVFSFSKAYGMAGNRLGYLTGPAEAVAQIHKIGVHTVYSATTASQLAGVRALADGGDWIARARSLYQQAGEDAAIRLGLPLPDGSTFLFLHVGSALDTRGVPGFLEDCLEDGVVLAPGASCGEAYTDWVRLCYTAAPPAEVAEGVRRLARRLGGTP